MLNLSNLFYAIGIAGACMALSIEYREARQEGHGQHRYSMNMGDTGRLVRRHAPGGGYWPVTREDARESEWLLDGTAELSRPDFAALSSSAINITGEYRLVDTENFPVYAVEHDSTGLASTVRLPKALGVGTVYLPPILAQTPSYAAEMEAIEQEFRAALDIVVQRGIDRILIGTRETAEIWISWKGNVHGCIDYDFPVTA